MARRAPKKGLGPKDDWGGYGNRESYIRNTPLEVMAGGNIKSLLFSAATRISAPARNVIRNVGSWAAEASGEAGRFVPKTGRIVRPRGDVYTPQGVFKGPQTFIKKPDLTPNQIAGIEKAMETRAANELARQMRIGKRAATAAGAAGVVGGVFAGEAAETVVGAAKSVVKKARGGGKNRR